MEFRNPLKKLFLNELLNSFGNVSAACEKIGISRDTIYKWIKNDHEFAAYVNSPDVKQKLVDIAEHLVTDYIGRGARQKDRMSMVSLTAAIFALKTQGKRRGWVETPLMNLGIQSQGDIKVTFNLNANNDNQLPSSPPDALPEADN